MDIVTVYALRQLYKVHGCATVFANGEFLEFVEEDRFNIEKEAKHFINRR